MTTQEFQSGARYIEVHLIQGPLGPPSRWEFKDAGALVCFEGVVRPLENGQIIEGLMYDVYEPMASQQIRRICQELLEHHVGLLAMRVEHSVGWVLAGQCAFRLRLAAKHRQESFAAMQAFIDRLKADVPIWKSTR